MSAMGWAEKHPWMTFFIATSAIGGVVQVLKSNSAPAPVPASAKPPGSIFSPVINGGLIPGFPPPANGGPLPSSGTLDTTVYYGPTFKGYGDELDYDANLTRDEAGLKPVYELDYNQNLNLVDAGLAPEKRWMLYAGAGLLAVAAWSWVK